MLDNVFKYEEEIKNCLLDVWYDPKYQYYFTCNYREPWEAPKDGDWNYRSFVSLNKDKQVIGLFSYQVDRICDLAHNFGAINFSDDKFTFGMDLQQVIDDIFVKFGMNKLEFNVVCGNPIEKSYDRTVSKLGGRILCVRRDRAKLLDGTLYDEKLYEIMRKDYLKYKSKKGE